MKRIFCFLFLCAVFSISAASQVKVESSLSAVEVLIGQQVQLTVKATASADADVQFPKEAQLPVGVEFLGAVDMPTEKMADGMCCYQRGYVLTSFDDTLYYLPPFKVTVDGKEFECNKLALKVLPVEIDTTYVDEYGGPRYYGPKTIQNNPFDWHDWSLVFWLSILMLLLLALAYYLYLRLRDNKPVIAKIRIVKRLLPHQRAMQAIEEIKADKMVSSGDPKTYYTRLTDALRHYIEERYGFNAMEMTSSEIIGRLMSTDDPKSLDELRQLFFTADLVKFAKYSTLINENDANLVNAIEFINQTKIEEPQSASGGRAMKTELTAEEKRSQSNRFILKTAIGAIFAICVGLFVYISFTVYQLL
ncbi:MAG: hypothetical protein IJV24_08375 [Prevotella sp.]|nr:hypothetical protein [Prevotella sp.]